MKINLKKVDGRPNMGIQYILKINEYPLWIHYYRTGMFWFRIFGYGIHISDIYVFASY